MARGGRRAIVKKLKLKEKQNTQTPINPIPQPKEMLRR